MNFVTNCFEIVKSVEKRFKGALHSALQHSGFFLGRMPELADPGQEL